MLRAKLLNLPKAIKGLEPSAWQVNRPTWLRLQQHTTQTMRGLRDAEQPLLPPLPTRLPAQDVPATLKAAINGWLKPSPRRKHSSVLLDHVLAGFQAEFTAKPARTVPPAVAQDPLACRPPFWSQVTHNQNYNDFCIWNPNEGFDILVFLKQLPCTVEQMQNDVTTLRLKGRGLAVRIPPQTLVTMTNLKISRTLEEGCPRHGAGGACTRQPPTASTRATPSRRLAPVAVRAQRSAERALPPRRRLQPPPSRFGRGRSGRPPCPTWAS